MLFVSWRSQMEALSACEEIMTRSIAVWPQSTIVTDGLTDRQTDDTTPTIPTHWLVSHESAKTEVAEQQLIVCLKSQIVHL